MKNLTISAVLLLTIGFKIESSFAQKYKYGNVTKELLELPMCDFYKEADAMITYVAGDNSVHYSYSEGFYTVRKVKKQIKVFSENVKDIGSQSITFYSPKAGRGKVKLKGLKGKTYVLDNGKTKEIKLNDANVFETQLNNYYKQINFTMPNIQKNCLFEFEYELHSEYISNIDDWNLQEEYPVVYNEFYTSSPKYYRYQISVTGGYAPKTDKTDTYDERLQVKNTTYSGTIGSSSLEFVPVPFNKRLLTYENLPPVEKEPYTANYSDQQAKITHQLIIIEWPGEIPKPIATDYNNFSKSLLESSSFGGIIKKGDFIKDLVQFENSDSLLSKAQKVYSAISEKVKWNGYNHYQSEFNGKGLLKEGKGDAGDINLNYIAALNYIDVPTFPVIMSTRGHGTLHPTYPDYSDFNYVYAVSVINDKLYYSDATSGLPFGSLPLRCLNGSGWIVSDKTSDWIYTKKDYTGKHNVVTEILFDENKAYYNSTELRNNYFAYADHESIKNSSETEFLNTKYSPDNIKIDSILFVEIKNNSIKTKIKLHGDIEDTAVKYVYPFELRPFKSNPFKKETRSNIVDFPFLQEYKLVTSIAVQNDEQFEVSPNITSALEGNTIFFKYHSSYNSSTKKLNIIVDLKFNKNEFFQEEYAELKEALDNIINKLSEPVVIKKKL